MVRWVRSASELPMALMCSTSMGNLSLDAADGNDRDFRMWTHAIRPSQFTRRAGSPASAFQKGFEAPRQVFRLVVVQHVAGR